MSAPVRTAQTGTFFVTAVCAGRRRLFQVESNAQLLFDVLQQYRSMYRLHAFVIMPEHVHVLLTPLITLERSMQCIKGGFSKRYHDAGGRNPTPWQRGFTDHRIRDRSDYEQKKVYIEQNPVARHLVLSPEDFPWSSARRVKAGLSGWSRIFEVRGMAQLKLGPSFSQLKIGLST